MLRTVQIGSFYCILCFREGSFVRLPLHKSDHLNLSDIPPSIKQNKTSAPTISPFPVQHRPFHTPLPLRREFPSFEMSAEEASSMSEGGDKAIAMATEATEELYRLRDTYFPSDPVDKASKIQTLADTALARLDSIPVGMVSISRFSLSLTSEAGYSVTNPWLLIVELGTVLGSFLENCW